jgi:polyhydroxybutyrate depolymerase
MRLVRLVVLMAVTGGIVGRLAFAQENDFTDSLTYDDYERTFMVHLPPDYDGSEPVPLVIMLHGATMSGVSMMLVSDFNTAADAMGAIAVYPDGLAGRWGYLDADQLPPGSAYRDDVGFVRALIDDLSEEYTVDPSRIYMAGYSNGGMMALRLRCELEDRLAGVVAIGANLSFSLALHCLESDPVPVLLVLGTDDGAFPMLGYAVPTDDGLLDSVFSLNQGMTFLMTLNGCDNDMTTTEVTPPTGGTRVIHYTYQRCVGDTEAALYTLVDWDHDWPGYEATTVIGPVGDGLIRDAIWAFFEDHRLGE